MWRTIRFSISPPLPPWAMSRVVDCEKHEIVSKNALAGEYAVATPAFVDGTIILRTLEHLYCIGK